MKWKPDQTRQHLLRNAMTQKMSFSQWQWWPQYTNNANEPPGDTEPSLVEKTIEIKEGLISILLLTVINFFFLYLFHIFLSFPLFCVKTVNQFTPV
jgi:hypothetical protein